MASASDRRIIQLPLIFSGNVNGNIVLPLDDPSDNLTKKINLDQIKTFVLSGDTIVKNINVPTFSGDTSGSVGQITWDDQNLYLKTQTGWGKIPLDYNF